MVKKGSSAHEEATEQDVLNSLRECFPEGRFPGAVVNGVLTHQQFAELRQHLPRLTADVVKEWLPGVLYDVVLSRGTFMEERADLVVYFLDVIGEDDDTIAAARDREMILDFAENLVGGQPGEVLKSIMLEELPLAAPFDKLTREEKPRYMRQLSEASFVDISSDQSRAICSWLRFILQSGCAEFCAPDLERALEYWSARSR